MTNGITDPAHQWSDLLVSLTPRRREAVVAALRSSAEQGWPADREAVRLLVAYANGEIDAQDYAVGIVVSLGGHEELIAQQRPRPLESRPLESRPLESRPDESHPVEERRVESWATQQPPAAPPAGQSLSREEAVAAYVSGRMPVEEFLRITRGASA